MIYFKKIRGIILLILILLIPQGLILAQTINHAYIVQDNDSTSVKWLRDGEIIADTYKGNTLGIKELLISGSAQPSEQGWNDIIQFISKHKPSGNKPIWVIDLRQETHGYLNGQPITLYSEYDWINKGKNNQQSALDEKNWLLSLSTKKKITNVLSKHQFATQKYLNRKLTPVKEVQSEEQLISKLGLNYHRLYVTDHMAPESLEVDAFITLIKSIPKDTWLHIHCRGGKGRTTTFLVMYDMLKNADKVTFAEIIARHASVPPYYNLFEVNRDKSFLTPYYKERIIFLFDFYQFAQKYLKGYQGTWQEWQSTR